MQTISKQDRIELREDWAAIGYGRLHSASDGVPRGGIAGEFVYYIQKRGRIKIGYTQDLTGRMFALRPEALLAVERGGLSLEKRRHAEFAQYRLDLGTPEREWYSPAPRLMRHIALTAQRLDFPDLGAMKPPITRGMTFCSRYHFVSGPNILAPEHDGGPARCRTCMLVQEAAPNPSGWDETAVAFYLAERQIYAEVMGVPRR